MNSQNLQKLNTHTQTLFLKSNSSRKRTGTFEKSWWCVIFFEIAVFVKLTETVRSQTWRVASLVSRKKSTRWKQNEPICLRRYNCSPQYDLCCFGTVKQQCHLCLVALVPMSKLNFEMQIEAGEGSETAIQQLKQENVSASRSCGCVWVWVAGECDTACVRLMFTWHNPVRNVVLCCKASVSKDKFLLTRIVECVPEYRRARTSLL